MKKTIIIILLTFFTSYSFSQNSKYISVWTDFKENYNNENFVNIFNNFSTQMQNALPLEKTKQFLTELKLQVGAINEEKFLKFESQSYAVYKTTFEKAILAVNISIDENNKINGFIVKPFVEDKKSNLVNGLSSFPLIISDKIYSLSKDFPNQTQISIALIHKGKVNYYGVKIENDTIKSFDNRIKIFEIGSITKVFTSSVLASLVVDHQVNLNDLVNDYYPFAFSNNFKPSFLNLANHTSGLPKLPNNFDLTNETNPYKNYGDNEINAYLSKIVKPENKDGIQKYNYSNLGAGLLGHTLGRSQKQKFKDLLQKRIFDKYQMNNSYTSPIGIESLIVKGLNQNGQEVSNWEFDALFGGGGILSCTEDLVKFSKAQFDKKNKELELTRKPTFTINENMKIGLGWHILKSGNDFNLIWHNGGTGGYSSSMVLDVENRNGVIILSNVSAFHPKTENIEKLCFELMKLAEHH